MTYTEKQTQIAEAHWRRRPVSSIHPPLMKMRRTLRRAAKVGGADLTGLRMLEKELALLTKAHRGFYISVLPDGRPALGAFLMLLPELSAERITDETARLASVRYIPSMDIDSMIWQVKYCLLHHAFFPQGEPAPEVIGMVSGRLAALVDLDAESLCRSLNPMDRLYANDPLYDTLTPETRALYRKMTSEISIEAAIDEARLSREFMSRTGLERAERGERTEDRKRTERGERTEGRAHSPIYKPGARGRRHYGAEAAFSGRTSSAPAADLQAATAPIFTAEVAAAKAAEAAATAEVHHIGEIIMKDYRRVFPFARIGRYLLISALVTLVLSAGIGLFSFWWAGVLAFLPVFAVVKPVMDLIVCRSVRSIGALPSVELFGKIPPEAKTLCTISTLITSEKDIRTGLYKLRLARIKNRSENLTFCLLCDLKAAPGEAAPEDEKLLRAAAQIFAKEEGCAILIRRRRFCKTQGLWQGYERKRGAITALARLLRKGRDSEFSGVYGDKNSLTGVKYIAALDFDTVPLMDSISELVGIALHPVHKKIGIIAPRMTTSIDSYLHTGFSRAMSANGGCAGASTYDSFSGEMYQDCFGEGIFTGKGLIDVDIFLEECASKASAERFPEERILSHDILEGGCTGVAYAGNVEFSDSFPDTGNGYFKRQNRWLRGDLQNFRYVFDRSFSPLTRWKLADNVRRVLTPIAALLCLVAAVPLMGAGGGGWLFAAGLLSVGMPFLTGFVPSLIRGWRFSNYRRFYSPVVSQTLQLLRQLTLEVILLPKNALVSLDALVRTLWRTLFSKKHLLDWTTAAALHGKAAGRMYMIGAEALSLGLLVYAGWFFALPVMVVAVLFLAALPIMVYLDRAPGEAPPAVSDTMKKELTAYARKMWAFYADYVTEEHNHLPPDNVQYSPVYRVGARTSPTNIGMYLLSALSAYYFGFIEKNELEQRIGLTLDTLERLKKWHGNLMNWYDTRTLEVISPFVSSVDSGNYVCCLVALKEGLKQERCDARLVYSVRRLIRETNLRPFYNKARELFSIGYDTETGELSHHNYDLIMSESRMLSYYAVAAGQAGKRHWRALGRVMGRSGRYAAPVAWTGTMFEYFMPELLLRSKEGSMEYEALRFSLHCQQKRGQETGLPFGVSESGYYAFDEALNYQYKAHGVQEVGLKAGLDRERVVSPYSSFLSLAIDPVSSYNNLARMEKMGLTHPKYGFYEAADFTPHRVGSGYAVVKSHMAHHVGMSICGVANTLLEGRLQRLFLSDESMKRAEELLEEKIIAGEAVIGSPERQHEEDMRMRAREIREFSLDNIGVGLLSNGQLSVACADIGMQETRFRGADIFYRTRDLLRPRGSAIALVEGEYIMPFYNHPLFTDPTGESEAVVRFMQNSAEYYRNFRSLQMGMQVFLHPSKPVEYRRIAVENTSSIKRQLTLAVYLEPALARFRDIAAHPAFMDLFLKIEYDEEHKLIIASRKDRHSDEELVMAVGFRGTEDFTFSFNREDVIERNSGIFSAFENALPRESSTAAVPAPCIFVKSDFPVDASGSRIAELFYCYGTSADEVKSLALAVRLDSRPPAPSEEIISPLVYDTICGITSLRALPHILYTPQVNAPAVMENKLDIPGLWRYGISGDRRIVLYEFTAGKAPGAYGAEGVIEMKKALTLCQIEVDLVILYETDEQRRLCERIAGELGAQIYLVKLADTPEIGLIRAAACWTLRSDSIITEFKEPERVDIKKLRLFKKEPAEAATDKPARSDTEDYPDILPVEMPENSGKNRFHGDRYIIAEAPPQPWSHVLASSQFGTMVSDRGLGFSWALNSRENKLSPWFNDLRSDNSGEMLVMKTGSKLFDLIEGARAEFSPEKAEWHGVVKGIHTKSAVRVYGKGMGKCVTLSLENKSRRARTVSIAYYIEPVLGVDRDRAQFIRPEIISGSLVLKNPANGSLSGAMTVTCDRACSFVTSRHSFRAGEWGDNSVTPAHDIIAAAVVRLELPPKHKEKLEFILAFTLNDKKPLAMKNALLRQDFVKPPLPRSPVESDSAALTALHRYWLPWQTIGCRMWARTGFYQNSGAYGFRDQLQDCLCAMRCDPDIAKRQIVRSCTVQFEEGDVLHWWHDLLTVRKGSRTRYSDDLLWLPYVLAEYVKYTGDSDILGVNAHYASGEMLPKNEHEKYIEIGISEVRESVYHHAKRTLERAYKKGSHELLLMGCGDWCDGYNSVGLGGKGESVWLSMFYAVTARAFAPIARHCGEGDYADVLQKRADTLVKAIDRFAWDGKHYLRAFYDDGRAMGSDENDQCRIDLLPQAFAVFADMPDETRKISAINEACDRLVDEHFRLIRLFTPSFVRGKTWQKPGYVMSYPEGVRENGGQYTHAAAWLALACLRLGMRERAKKLALLLAPFDRSAEYRGEPYYMSADIYTNPQAYGRAGWSLYTGSAGWYFRLLEELAE